VAKGHLDSNGFTAVQGKQWKLCEDCGLKRPSFGLRAERKARWCGGCAKGRPGATGVLNAKCEDCKTKQPNYGLPAEGKKRWCSGCAKAHLGAAITGRKRCEDCGLKQPSRGLPSEGRRARWCADCAHGHPGAAAREEREETKERRRERKKVAAENAQKEREKGSGPPGAVKCPSRFRQCIGFLWRFSMGAGCFTA
jgi:hypothetical protein